MFQPQNLVLTGEFPDCDVKLCDFGISRYISHGADIREILGTPDYVGESLIPRVFHEDYSETYRLRNRDNVTMAEGSFDANLPAQTLGGSRENGYNRTRHLRVSLTPRVLCVIESNITAQS